MNEFIIDLFTRYFINSLLPSQNFLYNMLDGMTNYKYNINILEDSKKVVIVEFISKVTKNNIFIKFNLNKNMYVNSIECLNNYTPTSPDEDSSDCFNLFSEAA